MGEFIKVNYSNCDYVVKEFNNRLQELESIRFDLNLINRRLMTTRFSVDLFSCYKLLEECNDLISDFLIKFNRCIDDISNLDNDYYFKFTNANPNELLKKPMSNNLELTFKDSIFKTKFYLLMKDIYGFSQEECMLLLKSYNLFKKNETMLSRREFIHKYFAYICGLSFAYNGNHNNWLLTAGIPSYNKAYKYFMDLGLSDDEVTNLVISINMQHGLYTKENFLKYDIDLDKYDFNDYENHTSFANSKLLKDFTHEIVEIATFAYPSYKSKILADLGSFGYANEMSSYKGDVWSQSMPADDYRANIDAINIYNKLINSDKDVLDIFVNYNADICTNSLNRVEELYKYYGDGDLDVGRDKIIHILDVWSPANELITNRRPIILDYFMKSYSINSMSSLLPNEEYNELYNKYVMDNINNLNSMKQIQEQIEFLKDYFINALDKELEEGVNYEN